MGSAAVQSTTVEWIPCLVSPPSSVRSAAATIRDSISSNEPGARLPEVLADVVMMGPQLARISYCTTSWSGQRRATVPRESRKSLQTRSDACTTSVSAPGQKC